MTSRNWILLDTPPAAALADSQLPMLIRQLLWQRGIREASHAEEFLSPSYDRLPDPFLYDGMAVAVERIQQAIATQELITVYGDYDADGICATAIMVEALTAFGANVSWYVPERLAEGYGLNMAAVDELAKNGTQVLVTVDCGTTNIAEVSHAKELGLDVIVLDHHQQGATLPPAVAIINPNLAVQSYPFHGHSSGGVAYTITRAMVQKISAPDKPTGWEKWLLDLVAISTVADMMPLKDENRILVQYGLHVLRKNRRPGLKALFGIMGTQPEQTTETTIGFQIAPRLNAAGRLHHAGRALELLLTKDPAEAATRAAGLQSINAQRQRLTELAVAEALEQIDQQGEQAGYIAYAPHWSPGIVGLIAGRLVERVWRPVLVMTDNGELIVGSGRSIPGFDITAHLRTGEQHFQRFGGHAGACGFTLTSRDGRTEFQVWFQESLRGVLDPAAIQKPLTVDLAADLEAVTPETVDALEQLGPFGMGHDRPRFLVEQLEVVEATPVGANRQHLRLKARQGNKNIGCIAFSAADRLAEAAGTIDAVVEFGWNEWNGTKSLQAKIIDFRPSHE